jgi:nucleoside-diphosphate-sugar epimerase
MKLLVTGAGGFLGQYVVATAVRRGHDVRAIIRPASKTIPAAWREHPQIETVKGDLRSKEGLQSMVAGVDGVVHLAAAKAGDLYEQFSSTVIATENLLAAMSAASIDRLTLISSFSVYEYMNRRDWDIIDEASPLAANPFLRDEYCQTKLVQEQIALECARSNNWQCVVLRPGVIFGRGNLWTARLGAQLNDRWWIRTGAAAPLPLSYVENCADAVILSAEYNGPQRTLVLNVVDGETPSQQEYLDALREQMTPRPHIVPIPWTAMRLAARLAWLVNRVCFRGTAKVPGLFVPARLHARCKPFRYTNDKIVSSLKWKPKYTWKEGIQRSLEEADAVDWHRLMAHAPAHERLPEGQRA